MQFQEYAVVKIIGLQEDDRYFDGSPGVLRAPRIGDTGTIVHIASDVEIYIVECVASTGETVWLADFLPQELELVSNG